MIRDNYYEFNLNSEENILETNETEENKKIKSIKR